MNESALRRALEDKCILFVDDRRITIEFYREELQERYGARTLFAPTLEDALRKLAEDQPISAVVIDQNFPPGDMPNTLWPYIKQLGQITLNSGQTLGLYVHDKHPDIPYCYLTVVPGCYNPTAGEFGGDWKPYVLDKMETRHDQLPQILVDLMGWNHPPLAPHDRY